LLLTLLTRVGPVVLGGALRVQSEVACPDPEEVSAKVQKIVDLSDESAKAVHANAYTVGSNVVFQRDQFDPSSDQGRLTLAHELTHVVQQDAHGEHGKNAGSQP